MATFMYARFTKAYPDKKVKSVVQEKATGSLFVLLVDGTSLRIRGKDADLELTNFDACGVEICGHENPEKLSYLPQEPEHAGDLNLFSTKTHGIELAVGYTRNGKPCCKSPGTGFQCQALRPLQHIEDVKIRHGHYCGLGPWGQKPLRNRSGVIRPNRTCPLHKEKR